MPIFTSGFERKVLQLADRDDEFTLQDSGRVFSSAMFGFNKEEVLEYLEQMADEHAQRQLEAEGRIQELTKQVQALEAGSAGELFGEDTQANEELAAQLQEQAQQLEELSQDLDIAREATQQSEEELQDFKEQLNTVQQENAWLREEYQRSQQYATDLGQQLQAANAGHAAATNTQEIERQLQTANANAAHLQEQLRIADSDIAELRAQLDDTLDENDKLHSLPQNAVHQTTEALLADANAEANRIRDDAIAERERLHSQIKSSTSGLAESIANLRAEISTVESDVGQALETMQFTLVDMLMALSHTEQNINTFNTQINRFPTSAPPAGKEQHVVYFPPEAQYRPETANTTGGLQRVEPTPQPEPMRPFQPTYTTSRPGAAMYWPNAAAAQPEDETEARETKLRALSESLADTLRQLMES